MHPKLTHTAHAARTPSPVRLHLLEHSRVLTGALHQPPLALRNEERGPRVLVVVVVVVMVMAGASQG